MKQLYFFHFISTHNCISYFIQDTRGQRNIKIILLQMILYPVALFQQKNSNYKQNITFIP